MRPLIITRETQFGMAKDRHVLSLIFLHCICTISALTHSHWTMWGLAASAAQLAGLIYLSNGSKFVWLVHRRGWVMCIVRLTNYYVIGAKLLKFAWHPVIKDDHYVIFVLCFFSALRHGMWVHRESREEPKELWWEAAILLKDYWSQILYVLDGVETRGVYHEKVPGVCENLYLFPNRCWWKSYNPRVMIFLGNRVQTVASESAF